MTQIGIEQNSPSIAEMLGVEPARAILAGVVDMFPDILQRLRNLGQEDQE